MSYKDDKEQTGSLRGISSSPRVFLTGFRPPSVHIDMTSSSDGISLAGDTSTDDDEEWKEGSIESKSSVDFSLPASPAASVSNHGGDLHKNHRLLAIRSEKKLITLAIRLAFIEKAASKLGVLGFIWATVVLLGGFASDLKLVDFWFVTVILVVQGARIFSTTHQLRWQHHRNLTGHVAVTLTERTKIFFMCDDLPGLMSRTLYYLQLPLATVCGVLSLLRIIKRDYSRSTFTDGGGAQILKTALNIFYSVVLLEALVSLAHKAYLEINFTVLKLLDKVDGSYGFPINYSKGGSYAEHFFYYVYSKCIHAHALDTLSVDLVSYAEELLLSKKHDQQLRGATILCKITSDKSNSSRREHQLENLRFIGNNKDSLERLIEMVGWENTEREIRASAAMIVRQLVGQTQNAHRIACIPGCMESIRSLLSENGIYDNDLKLSVEGLGILVSISREHETRGNIGNTRGLLSKIINFTAIDDSLKKDGFLPNSYYLVDLAVKVLRRLARTKGSTGSRLRCDILMNVFIVSNLKSILQEKTVNHCIKNNAIDVLKYLAMEDNEARDRIGRTGGIIKVLLNLFLYENNHKASQALFFLSLDHPRNCRRMVSKAKQAKSLRSLDKTNNCQDMVIRGDMASKLLSMLNMDQGVRPTTDINIIYSTNILRSIIKHGDLIQNFMERIVNIAWPIAFHHIKTTQKEHLLQSFLGLAVAIFQVTKPNTFGPEDTSSLITRLHDLLKKYKQASTIVPNIRRYTIELASLIMSSYGNTVEVFNSMGFSKALKNVIKTTTELESYYMFSGSIGLNEHNTNMHDIVENVINQLSGSSQSSQ